MKLFEEVDLLTIDSFEQTLINKFKLRDLFVPDPDVPYELNLVAFGDLLRAYVPLRIAIFDGQHRMALVCYFVTGNYFPTPVINSKPFLPNKVQAFVDERSTFPVPDPSGLKYSELQMHTRQTVAISFLRTVPLKLAVPKLNMKGKVKTQNQGIHITQTFDTVMIDFLMALKEERLLGSMAPLNHTNFWDKSADSKKWSNQMLLSG